MNGVCMSIGVRTAKAHRMFNVGCRHHRILRVQSDGMIERPKLHTYMQMMFSAKFALLDNDPFIVS